MYVKGVKYFTEQQIKGGVKVFESAFYSFYATSIQRYVIHVTGCERLIRTRLIRTRLIRSST